MDTDDHVRQTSGELQTDLVKNLARFRKPVNDGYLNELISDEIPTNTKKSTTWAIKMFDEWRKSCNPNGKVLTMEDLNHWLSCFFVEVTV